MGHPEAVCRRFGLCMSVEMGLHGMFVIVPSSLGKLVGHDHD